MLGVFQLIFFADALLNARDGSSKSGPQAPALTLKKVTHLRRDFIGDSFLSKELPLPNSRKQWSLQTVRYPCLYQLPCLNCHMIERSYFWGSMGWVLHKEKTRLSVIQYNTLLNSWRTSLAKMEVPWDFPAMWHLKKDFEHYRFVQRWLKLAEGSVRWIPVSPACMSTK